MNEIAKSLDTPLINIHMKRVRYDENVYLVKTDRIKSKEILFSYLDKYSLFGYKYFAQKNFRKIHNLIRNNEYKIEEGKEKFLKLSELIKYNAIRDN
jgi:LAGLIDADG endonuclease